MPRQAHCSVRKHLHSLSAAQRLEITHVELEAAILEGDNLANFIDICIFPVRREAHDFAFIAVLSIADEIANHGVKAAERVRQEHAVEHLNFRAFTARHHGGDEIS